LLLAGQREARRERRDRLADHVVGIALVEAGLEPGIGGVGDRIGILSGELDRLAADDIGIAAVGKVGGVLRAVIEARAAFDAVVAGVFVPCEQIGLVEHQALRVLVGLQLRNHLVGADDQLGDRFDDLLAEGGVETSG